MTLGDVSALPGFNTTAPIAAPNLVKTDNQTAIDIDVLSNDFDMDHDPITLANIDLTSKLGMSLFINDDGTIAYDPTTMLGDLGAGEKVRDQFTYQIADPYGNLDRTMVFIDITGAKELTLSITNVGTLQIMAMSKSPVLAHNFAVAPPAPTFNPLTIAPVQPVSHGMPSSLERLFSLDDEHEGRLELLLIDESA